MPAPPYSDGKTVPNRPSLPSSLMVASGNSLASSHVITLGAISRSANWRTLFFSCCCSSFSWKSKISPVVPSSRLEHRPVVRQSYGGGKALGLPKGASILTIVSVAKWAPTDRMVWFRELIARGLDGLIDLNESFEHFVREQFSFCSQPYQIANPFHQAIGN